MRITSSDIGMNTERYYGSYQQSSMNRLVMVGTSGLLSGGGHGKEDAAGNLLVGEEAKRSYSTEHTYEDIKKKLQEKLNQMSSYTGVKKLSYLRSERDALSTIREQCMQYLMAIFFGDTKKLDYTEMVRSSGNTNQTITEMVYCHQEHYYEETEETSFAVKGTVSTADGREISIGINVEMSRSFAAYYSGDLFQIQERALCDPLVINLDTDAAGFSNQTFYFDIDADGKQDEISELMKGSGYLALDKNGDGRINDGSELFGTRSGDGFADLSAYDEDGNGWIDEADSIWQKLLIWTKDENGEDICYRLKEKGVGAICLSHASTDYSLNDAQNQTNGRIRATGLFLYESGMAGTIQHVDVAKHEQSFDAAG